MIEIGVPVEEIDARRDRVEKTRRFERPDRVPVIPAIGHRFLVPRIGRALPRLLRAIPETMLRTQILAQKWLMENIRTDAYAITGPWVGAWTDFQNTFEAGSLGVDVVFPDDDIPWVGRGWVTDEADLRRLEAMDFVHTGINARQIAFRQAMMAVAEKYPVRFQGGPVFYPGANPALTHTSDGPFGVAGDLMGKTELFLAVEERPGFRPRAAADRHRTSSSSISTSAGPRSGSPRPRTSPGRTTWPSRSRPRPSGRSSCPRRSGCASISTAGLSLHMCGRSDHLLEIFRDDLAIHELQGFGYEVDLDRIAEVLGGRVVLLGNVNPDAHPRRDAGRGPGGDRGASSTSWPRSAGSSSRTATTSRRARRSPTSTP